MNISQEITSSLERRPATERLSLPVARKILPDGDNNTFQVEPITQARLPALQRLKPPTAERVPLLLNGAANSESGRLQDVTVQYLEDTFPLHILTGSGGPSSSRLPAKERLSLPQESPIRSLSGDRRQVAAGLIINSPVAEDQPRLEAQERPLASKASKGKKPTVPKATGKKKAPEKPPAKKKGSGSPLQGVSLKKHRVCKAQNSPCRKVSPAGASASTPLPATGSRARAQQSTNPQISLIPAMTRQGTDFRARQNTLL